LEVIGPAVLESEELDGGEGVCSVDGYGDEDEDPEPAVGEEGAARLGFEVVEILCNVSRQS
jgi:hypothetical protein